MRERAALRRGMRRGVGKSPRERHADAGVLPINGSWLRRLR
jgi:hypothetical protein